MPKTTPPIPNVQKHARPITATCARDTGGSGGGGVPPRLEPPSELNWRLSFSAAASSPLRSRLPLVVEERSSLSHGTGDAAERVNVASGGSEITEPSSSGVSSSRRPGKGSGWRSATPPPVVWNMATTGSHVQTECFACSRQTEWYSTGSNPADVLYAATHNIINGTCTYRRLDVQCLGANARALLAQLRSGCNPPLRQHFRRDLPAMAVAANTEEQAAQVQAAQEAGFGPHMALQITGVTQTPELNGLLCKMEDLRNHQVFPVTATLSSSAPADKRACRPAIPSRVLSHLSEAQEQAGPGPRAHHRERGRHRRRQPGRHAARPPTPSAFTLTLGLTLRAATALARVVALALSLTRPSPGKLVVLAVGRLMPAPAAPAPAPAPAPSPSPAPSNPDPDPNPVLVGTCTAYRTWSASHRRGDTWG